MEDWLYGAVDLLASEYGWSYRDILFKTYPDDFFLLVRQIRIRKLDEYIAQISIATHPHRETDAQEEFVEDLLSRQRFMRGEPEISDELDVAAFEKLREQLAQKSMLIKVSPNKNDGE